MTENLAHQQNNEISNEEYFDFNIRVWKFNNFLTRELAEKIIKKSLSGQDILFEIINR